MCENYEIILNIQESLKNFEDIVKFCKNVEKIVGYFWRHGKLWKILRKVWKTFLELKIFWNFEEIDTHTCHLKKKCWVILKEWKIMWKFFNSEKHF